MERVDATELPAHISVATYWITSLNNLCLPATTIPDSTVAKALPASPIFFIIRPAIEVKTVY
jgi:hypothetical protein